MFLRGLGAMNGLRGGAGPPSTGFEIAVEPSNGVTDPPFGSPMIGTTQSPGVCATATAAHVDHATRASAATSSPAPQPLWRIRRRAYARLVRDGAEAARADS